MTFTGADIAARNAARPAGGEVPPGCERTERTVIGPTTAVKIARLKLRRRIIFAIQAIVMASSVALANHLFDLRGHALHWIEESGALVFWSKPGGEDQHRDAFEDGLWKLRSQGIPQLHRLAFEELARLHADPDMHWGAHLAPGYNPDNFGRDDLKDLFNDSYMPVVMKMLFEDPSALSVIVYGVNKDRIANQLDIRQPDDFADAWVTAFVVLHLDVLAEVKLHEPVPITIDSPDRVNFEGKFIDEWDREVTLCLRLFQSCEPSIALRKEEE